MERKSDWTCSGSRFREPIWKFGPAWRPWRPIRASSELSLRSPRRDPGVATHQDQLSPLLRLRQVSLDFWPLIFTQLSKKRSDASVLSRASKVECTVDGGLLLPASRERTYVHLAISIKMTPDRAGASHQRKPFRASTRAVSSSLRTT